MLASLLDELFETMDIECNSEMMKAVREGEADIKAGKVKEFHEVLDGDAANEAKG